jgi:hypothetical protein
VVMIQLSCVTAELFCASYTVVLSVLHVRSRVTSVSTLCYCMMTLHSVGV